MQSAQAGKPEKDLKALERSLHQEQQKSEALKKKAEALKKDLDQINRKMIAAAAKVQATEAEMLDHEIRLLQLQDDEKAMRGELIENKEAFVRALMALQRMARHPPEALLVHPLTPSETVRGAILLRSAVPKIEQQAARLKEDLASLSQMVAEIETRQQGLKKATVRLKEEQTALSGLVKTKKAVLVSTEGEASAQARKIASLAKKAKSLKDLLAKIEKQQVQAEKEKKRKEKEAKSNPPKKAKPVTEPYKAKVAFSGVRGRLPYPVVGRKIKSFGETEKNGLTSKGIVVESKPGAQVIAPHQGRVVYAGRFRGYGQLLIVEHGEGYHSLLAGMGRIDAETGQTVLTGEPVGIMGGSKADKPGLYIEIRRGGEPINPLPWLAAKKS